MGNVVYPADGQQHMAGIQRAGGAGGAGGGTDTFIVQKQQKGLPFDTLKTEVHIAGEPMHGISIEDGVGDLGQAGDQLVPQRSQLGGVFVKMLARLIQRRRHSHNGRHILRTCAFAALLCAALDQRRQQDPLSRIQHADPLRTVKLVG